MSPGIGTTSSSKQAAEVASTSLARRALLAAVPGVSGVLVALLLGAAIVAVSGRSPFAVLALYVERFSAYDLGQVVSGMTVFIFTGLAVAYAFQAGLFNIGGEGQLLAGGLAVGLVGAEFSLETSAWVAIPLCVLAAFVAGAAWAALPAVLRARFGVHEVISTILMNLIAAPLAVFFLNMYRAAHKAQLAEATHTLEVSPGCVFSNLDALSPKLSSFAGSDASTAVFLALATALVLKWVIARTRAGYELRAVGQNAEAAGANGIPVASVIGRALLVSGGLAGLASVPFVLGNALHHYFELDMLKGAGFTGIAVAVLAGNEPARVIVAAGLLALLAQSGEVVNGSEANQIPKELVQVLEAVVIVSVLVAQGTLRRALARAEARRAKRGE